MFKIVLSIFSIYLAGAIVSLYSLNLPDIDGNMISLNQYRGKKILIVNTASNSGYINQLTGLQQLYQQEHDSVMVIAFPSNSFGNEPKSNSQVKAFMQQQYAVTFPIMEKSAVTGDSANIVYKWLANKIQNGKTDAPTGGDFQKFLINKKGVLVAIFDSSTAMNNQVLLDAIKKY